MLMAVNFSAHQLSGSFPWLRNEYHFTKQLYGNTNSCEKDSLHTAEGTILPHWLRLRIICIAHIVNGVCFTARGSELWNAVATNRKVAGSIPACVIGIFHWHKILPIVLLHWGRFSL